MRVLVVGSGGREHALCWSLRRSPHLQELFCAPGNPGTAEIATSLAVAADDLEGIVSAALRERIDLVVVGPEQPLCAGLADRCIEHGLLVAGPSAAAARLEGSKVFAKRFLERAGIPTAAFAVCEDLASASAYLESHPRARVVKADGLAAGKGVVVASSLQEAEEAAARLLERGPIVIEERLEGEEVSVLALADGERVVPLASSQDHKAAFDGDEGPNTGGMGAYSPAPVLDGELAERVRKEVLERTIEQLAAEGTPFRGVLYAGLMIVDGELSVLEFNCRFGDPETQAVLPRLQTDLLPLLLGAAKGALPTESLRWDPRPALSVVLAGGGYPGPSPTGLAISGIEAARALPVLIFQAGTARRDEQLVTAGGRVLAVTALGESLQSARDHAYEAAELITWQDRRYRNDIGYRALQRRLGP